MSLFERFHYKALRALREAEQVAIKCGNDYIGTEHIMVACVKNVGWRRRRQLAKQGITGHVLLEHIQALLAVKQPEEAPEPLKIEQPLPFTPQAKLAIEQAANALSPGTRQLVSVETLLTATIQTEDSIAHHLAQTYKII